VSERESPREPPLESRAGREDAPVSRRVLGIPLDSILARAMMGVGLISLLLFVAGFVFLSGIFQRTVERDLTNRLTVILDDLKAAAEITEEGRLDLDAGITGAVDARFERGYSGWYWQIYGDASSADLFPEGLESITSKSLATESLDKPPELAPREIRAYNQTGPDNQPLKALATKTNVAGDTQRLFTIVVAADRSDLLDEVTAFNRTLIIFMTILFGMLMISSGILIRMLTRPLDRVREDLSAVRSGRARRLEARMPSELRPLTQEINTLLDHNETVVERARTQVGNLAHALKTPLTVLANEAHGVTAARSEDQARERARDLPGVVSRQAGIMRDQVERYLARARTAASAQVLGARCDAAPVLEDIARTLTRITRDRSVVADLDVPGGAAFRGERQDFEEIAGNLLDNAYKWARGNVQVRVERHPPHPDRPRAGARLVLVVGDDGPGLSEDKWPEALKRGQRLDETVPGSGLGLSIVADIAEAYGGTVTLAHSPLGGLEVRVDLPAAG